MEDIIGPQKNHYKYKYLISKNKNVLLDIKPNRDFFWGGGPHLTACGILVPQPGIEPMSLAVEAES